MSGAGRREWDWAALCCSMLVSSAAARGKRYIWLGVWEHNSKAMRFYQKNGFYRISEHSFFVGDDEQTDIILRKDL